MQPSQIDACVHGTGYIALITESDLIYTSDSASSISNLCKDCVTIVATDLVLEACYTGVIQPILGQAYGHP